jgi:choline dehydrogenase-like flavoprotein
LDLSSNQIVRFKAKNVFLAAGAINTTRILLRSFSDTETKLKLIENPMLQIPGILLGRLGKCMTRHGFGSFLFNMVYELDGDRAQGGFLELSSIARADLFGQIPVPASLQIESLRRIAPAVLVNILFFSSDFQTPSIVGLKSDGGLKIQGGANHFPRENVRSVVAAMNRAGLLSSTLLARGSPVGASIHYGGTIPMCAHVKRRYELNARGQLESLPGVFVVDAAAFPRLPAKNHSLTLMANAMRVADLATN